MIEMIIIELTLPWPPKELNPNSRVHWTKRAKAAKSYKKTCWAIAKQHKHNFSEGNIFLELIFHPPRNNYDSDNCESMFKSGRDGIAIAWGLNDKLFRPVLKDFGRCERPGKIIATFSQTKQ